MCDHKGPSIKYWGSPLSLFMMMYLQWHNNQLKFHWTTMYLMWMITNDDCKYATSYMAYMKKILSNVRGLAKFTTTMGSIQHFNCILSICSTPWIHVPIPQFRVSMPWYGERARPHQGSSSTWCNHNENDEKISDYHGYKSDIEDSSLTSNSHLHVLEYVVSKIQVDIEDLARKQYIHNNKKNIFYWFL